MPSAIGVCLFTMVGATKICHNSAAYTKLMATMFDCVIALIQTCREHACRMHTIVNAR